MKKFLKVMVWINAIFECVIGIGSIIVAATTGQTYTTVETVQRVVSFFFGFFLLFVGSILLYLAIKDFKFPEPRAKKTSPSKTFDPTR